MTARVHSSREIEVRCIPDGNFPIELSLSFGDSTPRPIQTPAIAWLDVDDAEELVARLSSSIRQARADERQRLERQVAALGRSIRAMRGDADDE